MSEYHSNKDISVIKATMYSEKLEAVTVTQIQPRT